MKNSCLKKRKDVINRQPIHGDSVILNRFKLNNIRLKDRLTKIFVVLTIGLFSSYSYSWDETEQNVLKGLVGGLLIKHLYDSHKTLSKNNRDLDEIKQQDYNSYLGYDETDTDSFTSMNKSKIPHECQQNPYIHNKGGREMWLKGCLLRLQEKQKVLENQAFESGYQGY